VGTTADEATKKPSPDRDESYSRYHPGWCCLAAHPLMALYRAPLRPQLL